MRFFMPTQFISRQQTINHRPVEPRQDGVMNLCELPQKQCAGRCSTTLDFAFFGTSARQGQAMRQPAIPWAT